MGGKASQRSRRGHRWTPQEARAYRQAQLDKKREDELFMYRLRAKLREQLGPSPGPPKGSGEPSQGGGGTAA